MKIKLILVLLSVAILVIGCGPTNVNPPKFQIKDQVYFEYYAVISKGTIISIEGWHQAGGTWKYKIVTDYGTTCIVREYNIRLIDEVPDED